MVAGHRVLVIDGLHEIQDVLRTVLAPKGLRVDWIRSHCEQIPGETDSAPDVLVIDAQTSPQPADWSHVPRIVLEDESDTHSNHDSQEILRKPFQFPELIQAIERLLPKKAA